MKFADLHLHTNFSDGTYSPLELVQEAKKKGLAAIAVTDHDTVCGIEPALKAAQENDIEVIPGIELTVEQEDLEIHILGYLIDYHRKELLERLDSIRQSRIERVYKIVGKLEDINLKLDPQAVLDIAAGGTPGRLHIARAMVQQGLVQNASEAFQKYIGDKGPAYALGFKFSPQEAIKLIIDIGGIPVLAHPYTLKRDDLIPALAAAGLKGLEVYYSEHTQSMVNYYLELAKRYDLLVTGGSDCHGKAKPEVKIGSVKIPYELVEKLKSARRAS